MVFIKVLNRWHCTTFCVPAWRCSRGPVWYERGWNQAISGREPVSEILFYRHRQLPVMAGNPESRGRAIRNLTRVHLTRLDKVSAFTNEMISLFPVEREYARCVTALNRTGILTLLLKSDSMGVIGTDGKEYPLPTQEQVAELFNHNRELVSRKIPQGFDRLEFTPMAMPAPLLIDRMKAAILNHAAEGKIFKTRRSPSDPFIPVRVNTKKTVWIWDTLRQVLDTEGLVYFPQEYSGNHRGQTKSEVVNNGRICAVPGWSVGLVESVPIMPGQGEGKTIGGRRQLELTNITEAGLLWRNRKNT
jgi:hypothetical protein